MSRRLAAALITLTISILMIGCLGKTKYPIYYTLNLPPAPDPPAPAGARPSIAVREFRSADYLRQGAIVYRPSPEQVGFYSNQRWAVDPRTFVTHAIVDRLRASGRFATVRIYDGRSDVDFILAGRLEKLDEVDYESGVRVEVALSAQMTCSTAQVPAPFVARLAGNYIVHILSLHRYFLDRCIRQLPQHAEPDC